MWHVTSEVSSASFSTLRHQFLRKTQATIANMNVGPVAAAVKATVAAVAWDLPRRQALEVAALQHLFRIVSPSPLPAHYRNQ